MRSSIFLVTFLIFCLGCSSDYGEVVDLYDIDLGEEIVVVPSLGFKIPENLDALPEPTSDN